MRFYCYLGRKPNETMMFDSRSAGSSFQKNPARANLMSLSKEISDAEKNIRSQFNVTTMEVDGDRQPREKVWTGNGLFGEL